MKLLNLTMSFIIKFYSLSFIFSETMVGYTRGFKEEEVGKRQTEEGSSIETG